MASHELKTPLTSLNGFLEVLHQQTDAEHQNYNLVERCIKQVGKLNTLINELLDVSWFKHGKLPLKPERFDLALLIKETLSNYRHMSTYRFVHNVEGPLYILGDKSRLEQVLTNLINNAVKYSPASGIVEVTVLENAEMVLISIRDEGIGIDNEHFGEIFTQFYRAVDPKYQIQGLGLGLFISKEIIERHGGTIEVDSHKGAGSVFKIQLPKS